MTTETRSSKPRPPIVVVMGHVDHGKTTLLDYVRKANVAAKEAGGITQSIGAYEITHNDKRITFIDTPGHEAFIKMRARGATVADLAILVVAADEGVKPQTVESIKILNETKTPFVVAITKTDKSGADVEKVKNELTAAGVLLEGYGGQVSWHAVSAKSGEGVNELLDLILLTAEVEYLTYDPLKPASGFVLETKIDRRRGLEATLIVKNGALRQGDSIATPSASGRVKILENFLGGAVKALEPSAPALIIGFEALPAVGEEFSCDPSRAPVKQIREIRSGAPADSQESLRLILKARDAGSLEALSQIILANADKKPISIINESVGDVGDNDVKLAISTRAVIIAFKSKADKAAKTLAEANRVKIIASDIIYELVKAAEEFLKHLSEPTTVGELDVLKVFSQDKPEKQIVGGKVASGVFKSRAAFDILRGEEKVGAGRVLNLQREKKDANEVKEGSEAGLLINSQTLVKAGDRLVIQGTSQ